LAQQPSSPVVYEVRYQTGAGWAAPPPQGQSWAPNAEYGNVASPTPSQNGQPPSLPPSYPNSTQVAYSQQPQNFSQQQPVVQAAYNEPVPYTAQNQAPYVPQPTPSGGYPQNSGSYGPVPSPAYGQAPPPGYGAPAGAGPAYTYPSAPP